MTDTARGTPIPYGTTRTLHLPYAEAVERVRVALKAEGFGVITEIDLQVTFKKKLDREFRPYVILGACNPAAAFQALGAERDIGVLLPCNVVVYAGDEPNRTVVTVVDPEISLSRVGNPALPPLAGEIKARLQRVIEAIGR